PAARPGGVPHDAPPTRPPRPTECAPAASRRLSRRSRPRARSVAPVPLFQPRVAEDVVAVRLPEAGAVLVSQPQAAHPLRALPEVKMGYEQPRGAAVFRLERLAAVGVRDPGFAVGDVLERQVRRVVAVRVREQVLRVVVDVIQEGVDRDTLPDRVELRPLRDAVDVDRDLLARESLEFVPGPTDGLRAALDRERPLLERGAGRWPGGEHREVVDGGLSGRYPVGGAFAPAAVEAT